ncbi:MAG: winged helix-turn-helix domain-containing protein, partial [Firmicutes bacterium]|nr:winged helix-turn-helix domain-containing protein [Bacillota bacterium]
EEGFISDDKNRSRKVWQLLAYMIHHRGKTVSQAELHELLWGDDSDNDDPQSALRAVFYRARGELNKLGEKLGHDLIIRKDGAYAWNTEIPAEVDTEQFRQLAKEALAAKEAAALPLLRQALGLYKGDFLPKLSAEAWVIPVAVSYHDLYIECLQKALPLLEAEKAYEERAALCRTALKTEPYNEALYAALMRDLLQQGRPAEVVALYEEMSKRFFDDLGILPEEEVRKLYYEAINFVSDKRIPMEDLQQQLKEQEGPGGAMVCDFDFFRSIYHSTARLIERSGAAVHIALISAADERDGALPKRSQDRVMENLQELLRRSLRRGDVISRCSASQYVVMLPMANYENSCMVCDRLLKAFYRQYPHTPAKLTYLVQSLEVSEASHTID